MSIAFLGNLHAGILNPKQFQITRMSYHCLRLFCLQTFLLGPLLWGIAEISDTDSYMCCTYLELYIYTYIYIYIYISVYCIVYMIRYIIVTDFLESHRNVSSKVCFFCAEALRKRRSELSRSPEGWSGRGPVEFSTG